LSVRQRLGSKSVEILASGAVIAVHREGRGIVRSPEQRSDLKRPVLGQFTTHRACERKGNYPPGAAARAAAAALLGGPEAREVIVDLARYAELAEIAR
jgi:hypothetical protein